MGPNTNRTVDRILASRRVPSVIPEEYVAFRDSGGHPQVSFSVHRRNGDADGFLYHNIDNVSLKRRGAVEYVSFTHRGKAVTLQGTGLAALYQALLGHLLMEVNECPDREAYSHVDRRVDRVLVTLISDSQKAAEADIFTPRGDA